MNPAAHIAKLFRDVYDGNNWTAVNLKQTLSDVTWKEATTKVDSLNTIAALVYHINYYVIAQTTVLKNQPLNASDKYSFDLPPINSREDWETLLGKFWNDSASFAKLAEQLPEEKMEEIFVNEKYGTYYRNLHGVIEHTYYHLGQIVLLKKLIRAQSNTL